MKFFSDSHSGAIAEHFAKIPHEVVKSEYFFNISNESESPINSLFNIQFVGVSLVLQKLSLLGGGGGGGTTSVAYFAKVYIVVKHLSSDHKVHG